MSDVVVTSSDDAGESTAETLPVQAVAESARQSAIAEVAATTAVEASQGTELHAETATSAASVSIESADTAQSAAAQAMSARDETLAAVSSLTGLVETVREMAEKVSANPPAPTLPPAPAVSEDTAPQKVPFLKRKISFGRSKS